jgi:hypothetical protein
MTLVPITLLSRADRCRLGNNVRRERPRPVHDSFSLPTARLERATHPAALARRSSVHRPGERRPR